jgi:hypothetical protein
MGLSHLPTHAQVFQRSRDQWIDCSVRFGIARLRPGSVEPIGSPSAHPDAEVTTQPQLLYGESLNY